MHSFILPSFQRNSIEPTMTPIPRAYLPPFVWDLVYFDRHSLSSYTAVTSGTTFLSSNGLLVLDALQPGSVLPEVVLHGQVTGSPDPRDLDPFKHACVEVLTSLQNLIVQEGSLARLYSEQLSWMSESSQKSCEIWFDLFMVGSYDQAWLVGSTVLEQLLGTVSHCCQLEYMYMLESAMDKVRDLIGSPLSPVRSFALYRGRIPLFLFWSEICWLCHAWQSVSHVVW